MDKTDCRVAVRTADVHVLPEDGELLGKVAVEIRDVFHSWSLDDVTLGPRLKWVCTASANPDVEEFGAFTNGIAQRPQVAEHAGVVALNTRRDFNHALGNFELDIELRMAGARDCDQIRCGARQVAVAMVDQLQFQLDPQSQRLRSMKFERFIHPDCLVVSLARRNAHSVSSGPSMAIMKMTIAARSEAR